MEVGDDITLKNLKKTVCHKMIANITWIGRVDSRNP